MIIFNNVKYALDDNELIDSLFNDGEGTLCPLYKIKERKNDVLFFIDSESGFGFNRYGIPFKFSTLNGKKIYFHTFDYDKKTFTETYKEKRLADWSLDFWGA